MHELAHERAKTLGSLDIGDGDFMKALWPTRWQHPLINRKTGNERSIFKEGLNFVRSQEQILCISLTEDANNFHSSSEITGPLGRGLKTKASRYYRVLCDVTSHFPNCVSIDI